MDELKLIDTKELAQILGKSPRTIKRWKKQGKLPQVRQERKAYVLTGDLLRAIASQWTLPRT